MPTPRDLLNEAKASIREVDPADAQALLEGGGVTFLDVREPDEYEQGAIPGAVHLPRGHLEFQVEGKLPDKSAPDRRLLRRRRALGLRRQDDGGPRLRRRPVDVGGLQQVEGRGPPWAAPQTLTPAQRNRYQRHLLLPEVGEVGQLKLLDSKVLLLGAGGLGSPAALYLAAAGVGTLGIIDMDVVDESNLQRQILHNMDRVGERKVDSAKKTLTALNPDVNVVTYDVRLGADNILDIIDGYDVIVDGTDNFPTRYLVNDASLLEADPGDPRLDLPLRGPGHRLRPLQRAVLPLPHPRAAAGRAGAVVLRGGRAGRAARDRRLHPGGRDDQGAARARRPAGRPAARLRRAGGVVPHLQGAPGPGVPGLRARRRRDRHRRVRRPLHAPRALTLPSGGTRSPAACGRVASR